MKMYSFFIFVMLSVCSIQTMEQDTSAQGIDWGFYDFNVESPDYYYNTCHKDQAQQQEKQLKGSIQYGMQYPGVWFVPRPDSQIDQQFYRL